MSEKTAMRNAFGEALVEAGKSNEKLVVLDADVSSSTKTIAFKEAFPERFFNVGIAEQDMVAMAAGLATTGFIPVVSTFSFLLSMRAVEQIRTLIAYAGLNVKFAAGYSGLSDSFDGATHQSVCDIAIMRSIPNMTVVVPSDPVEAKIALKKTIDYSGPVFLRLSRAEVPVIFDKNHSLEIGKGAVVKDYGSDVAIIATGTMLYYALQAVEELHRDGIKAVLIEMPTIKPIDRKLINEIAGRTKAVVTVEEHSIIGGLSGAVLESLAMKGEFYLKRVGLDDTFAESGPYDELLKKYKLSKEAVIAAVNEVLQKKLNINQL